MIVKQIDVEVFHNKMSTIPISHYIRKEIFKFFHPFYSPTSVLSSMSRRCLMNAWSPEAPTICLWATKILNKESDQVPKTYNSQANFWRTKYNKIPCSFCTFVNEKCLVVGCRPKNISANNSSNLKNEHSNSVEQNRNRNRNSFYSTLCILLIQICKC